MKKYTECLSEEMEKGEGKSLTTPNGHKVIFKFQLIPADMKWVASMSGELNNCAHYFSSFANANQANKTIIRGTIGDGQETTWQPWKYERRLEVVKKVDAFKATPQGKVRSKVTDFIKSQKSRQETIPPLRKYVDIIKAEPLHITNNVWQHWFSHIFPIAVQYTSTSQLKAATTLSDLPDSATLIMFLKCLKEKAGCTRLYKAIERWLCEKRKKQIEFSYRFTGSDSKKLSWSFSFIVEELLRVQSLSNGSRVKLIGLHYIAVKLRDAAALYSRVEVTREQIEELKNVCQKYFIAVKEMIDRVTPTVWTLGNVVPFHTEQLFNKLGFGLGLNTMQGREAKHIKLARYVENTCNVRKQLRWTIVFRHEFVSLVWLREMDPYNSPSKQSVKGAGLSFIPKKVSNGNELTCYCGMSKSTNELECKICTSHIMQMIEESIELGRVSNALRHFGNS